MAYDDYKLNLLEFDLRSSMTETVSPAASEIKAIFDRIAPVYDRLNDRLSFGQHRIWKLMAVKWSEAKAGDHALDVCCGSGDLALLLAKQVGTSGRVTGLDFACEQLAIAKQRQLKNCPTVTMEWLEGDALALPFADHHFDCGTMGYGLRNVTNIPRSLKELLRVLKPGGKAAILDFHRPDAGLMQLFQAWYLANIVVPTASDMGMKEEYAYINPSVERFPTGTEQIELASEAGFTQAVHYPLMGGMMGILVLTK
jgi:demethylmenaquinone methyltransferase/2-methoxy-6-polyprenyl-1,4-benzoquinol methylase